MLGWRAKCCGRCVGEPVQGVGGVVAGCGHGWWCLVRLVMGAAVALGVRGVTLPLCVFRALGRGVAGLWA